MIGTGGASRCWVSLGGDACYQLGSGSKEDPELDAVLQWLGSGKKADLRMLLRECIMSKEGQMV